MAIHQSVCLDEAETLQYLQNYGYISTTSLENVASANDSLAAGLLLFQQYFDLDQTGELNEETIDLMGKPRCGVSDYNSNNFQDNADNKWNKTDITWSFFLANRSVLIITQKAFRLWADSSNLKFREHRGRNADITISLQRGDHHYAYGKERCNSPPFDGPGQVLAHAFLPYINNRKVEIHMDNEERWSLDTSGEEQDSTMVNFYRVLIHEIGHTIGLTHSNSMDSIMYPFYHMEWDFMLGDVDKKNIQKLYKHPKTTTPNKPKTTTTTTTTTPTPTPTTVTSIAPSSATSKSVARDVNDTNPRPEPLISDVCSIKNFNMLIVDDKMFVIHKQWLWVLDLNDIRVTAPIRVTDYLQFLPYDFDEITAIYQRPNGQILFIIKNMVYIVQYPTLELVYSYPRPTYAVFGIGRDAEVQSIFSTNTGKTFIMYNQRGLIEVMDYNFQKVRMSYVPDTFPGVPTGVEHAFRFTNGRLYFFKKGMFYEYDEFRKIVTRVGPINISMFGVKCGNLEIFDQLSKYLKEIKTYFVNDSRDL